MGRGLTTFGPAMPAAKPQVSAAKNAAPAPAAGRAPTKGDHVFLVDGSGYIFRAYHALPPLTRKSDGLQLNAVYGFCNMLWKLLRDMKPEERPTHLAIVFDKSEKTFRTDMYPAYKAHRPDPPDDLIPQFPLVRKAVQAFDLPCLEQAGFEADDLIATYARQACEAGAHTTIVSSDKDLMQLVNDCVVMYDTMKDKKIGRDEVIEKFGVPPDKVIEVQSLIGDSTDNVPGVPGIGVKTAAQLIGEYGDLETLLTRAGEIKQEKRRQSLDRECREGAHFEAARHARRSGEARRAARRYRGARARLPAADRLPQGDGVQLAAAPRGGILRRRSRRDRGRRDAWRPRRRSLLTSPLEGEVGRRSRPGGGCSSGRTSAITPLPNPPPQGGRERTEQAAWPNRSQFSFYAGVARRRTCRAPAQASVRPRALRDRAHAGPAERFGRARDRPRHRGGRRRNQQHRPDAGGALRHLAGARPERGLLRSAHPPQRRRRRQRRPVRRRHRAGSDRGTGGPRHPAAAPGEPRRPQGRAQHQVRLADSSRSAGSRRIPTTT